MMMTINNFSKNKVQLIALIFVVLSITSCKKNEGYELKTIKTDNGWGYTIYCNNKIIIKQTVIPVINIEKPFDSQKDALKLGSLVIEKLNNNGTPTVTKKDLILLDIKI